MKIINKIKKYRKSVGFAFITAGSIATALGVSLFTGGGLHGVGIPDATKVNSKDVQWTRVSMGFINFKGTGELITWLKRVNLIDQNETSISFKNFLSLSKDKVIRQDIKKLIDIREQELNDVTEKGAVGLIKELQIRTQLDLMQNLLLTKSMYELSVTGLVIFPIGTVIMFIGIYLLCSGVKKDKKETKEFMESLKRLNNENTK